MNYKNAILFLVFSFSQYSNAQTQNLINVIPFEKLPVVPYIEKSPQEIKKEEEIRTFVPIYSKNHLNFYSTNQYPLPLYGGWSLKPIHRYGCRTGDVILINNKGQERKFPIKTQRGNVNAKDWDDIEPIDCPSEASPKLLNSWIMNSRYIAFETSDPGFFLFDFIKGDFIYNLVLNKNNYPITLKSSLNGTIYFYAPNLSTVEQKRMFIDEKGIVVKATVNQSIHNQAFAFREMYMCQEALSWGESCTNIEQLKKIFYRKK